jgi:hypothetical protein
MKQQKKYIFSDQISLYGERECLGFGSENFYIKEIDKEISNDLIIKNHYAHKVAGFATTYIYLGIFENNKLLGSLQYGFAMNPASAKNIVDGTGIYEHLELNRMWLSDEIQIKYPESQAISMSISYIKKKYPKIKWIQSFADERCGGFGIVYQACSFNYYGEHLSEFYELDGKYYHKIALTNLSDNREAYQYIRNNKERAKKINLRQFRYIKFLDQREKKKCLLKEKPYPKHYK